MGKKTISGIMANVAWNTDEAEQVNTWTGHYPALNTFDYMHIRYSGQNWIDYSDISPVTNWANEGGIVSCMWHWNVPKNTDSNIDDYTATLSETVFNAQKSYRRRNMGEWYCKSGFGKGCQHAETAEGGKDSCAVASVTRSSRSVLLVGKRCGEF